MTSPKPQGNSPPVDSQPEAQPEAQPEQKLDREPEPKAETKIETQTESRFSWLDPHPLFVIILVGPQEQPFGIQKDFLCHRSAYYRKYFAETPTPDAVENIVRLPGASPEVFGLAQNFLYTGGVMSDDQTPISYENLVSLWNLGHQLGVEGLCDKVLDSMMECRRLTERIPSTPLLIQVWRDTPEGSSIRLLLLSWAAEYMRSSDARAEFAKSLPQEVLSELVVAMSSFDNAVASAQDNTNDNTAESSPANETPPVLGPRKNVHYLEDLADGGDEQGGSHKKSRRSASMADRTAITPESKALLVRKTARPPLPKPQKRRSSGVFVDGRSFTTSQRLEFCADLLTRMLSGPGFWTRLVGPFKEPVDPVEDGVPDYFDKVKRPMDLNTIKAKMDSKGYASDEEFAADIRQIFENCALYWPEDAPMYAAGEKLKKTFEEKFSHMNKWIAKMGGEDVD